MRMALAESILSRQINCLGMIIVTTLKQDVAMISNHPQFRALEIFSTLRHLVSWYWYVVYCSLKTLMINVYNILS